MDWEYRLASPEINEPITKELVITMLAELGDSIPSSNHDQLEGKEAITFAERHLRKLQGHGLNWEVAYEDPRTGEKWLMDYPNSEAHGGGSPRLRKLPPTWWPVSDDGLGSIRDIPRITRSRHDHCSSPGT